MTDTLTLSKASGTGLSVTADAKIGGNVGIGITGSVSEKLEVNGNIAYFFRRKNAVLTFGWTFCM